MPILFLSLSPTFTDKIIQKGYEARTMRIEDYIHDKTRKTYYVSPANSLCFMDGGIDYALSRIIFPDIEKEVKGIVRELGITSLVGKSYLPIGSSIIIEKENNTALVVSPTMLLPQNVSTTQNAYYATMAVLYNILCNTKTKTKTDIEDVDIIMTSFCCGYGKMDEDTSIEQMIRGINDYSTYKPTMVKEGIILHEPNLREQPRFYQNTEFFMINPSEIVNV